MHKPVSESNKKQEGEQAQRQSNRIKNESKKKKPINVCELRVIPQKAKTLANFQQQQQQKNSTVRKRKQTAQQK